MFVCAVAFVPFKTVRRVRKRKLLHITIAYNFGDYRTECDHGNALIAADKLLLFPFRRNRKPRIQQNRRTICPNAQTSQSERGRLACRIGDADRVYRFRIHQSRRMPQASVHRDRLKEHVSLLSRKLFRISQTRIPAARDACKYFAPIKIDRRQNRPHAYGTRKRASPRLIYADQKMRHMIICFSIALQARSVDLADRG